MPGEKYIFWQLAEKSQYEYVFLCDPHARFEAPWLKNRLSF